MNLTSYNHNYFNYELLSNVKKGSLFINVSRGGIVNEKDLAAQAAGRVDLNAITGHLFEGFTSAVSQAPLTESKSLFDFIICKP